MTHKDEFIGVLKKRIKILEDINMGLIHKLDNAKKNLLLWQVLWSILVVIILLIAR